MANDVFEFEIIAHDVHRSISAEWVSATAPTGEFVVAPGHIPFISLLSPGSKLGFQGKQCTPESMDIPGGMLIVGKDGRVQAVLWHEHAAPWPFLLSD